MTNTLTARSGQTPSFYRQIFKLVLPIILQNLLSSFVSSADVVMLNYVGQSSISAVSLASNYTNILFMVFYGLGTGATMLCAQYHGKGDLRAIQVIEGIALRFSLVLALMISQPQFGSEKSVFHMEPLRGVVPATMRGENPQSRMTGPQTLRMLTGARKSSSRTIVATREPERLASTAS